MEIKKLNSIYILFFFSFISLFLLICMHHTFAIAQGDEIERTITTSTGMGDITLKLSVYTYDDIITPLDYTQEYVSFKDCTALSLEDPNLLPLPWGDFPYGLWRAQIETFTKFMGEGEFDPNSHIIKMMIYFPAQINPLNAQYWAQEYNNDKKGGVWEEYDQGLDPNITNRSVTIWLSDSISPLRGFGDCNPGEGIDHVGGLLWPIPVQGRCFIDSIWSVWSKPPL